MPASTFVIIGASLAGATAAAALRKQGFDGRIVLIGEEPLRPYERPELSKAFLRGESTAVPFVHRDEAFYESAKVELWTGVSVQRIDPARREVSTIRGTVGYDRLLLATGAEPRRLDVPGGELPGVKTLRTFEDADDLRASAAAAERIVIVGSGWIGSEVAASLRQLGRDVTVVSGTSVPLERVLGPEIGGIYGQLHARHGVRILAGRSVVELRGHGHVDGVVLDDGTVEPADLVVAGIGAVPRTSLAAHAGLAVDNGILVDERLETTAPGVFAAGDVANAWSPRYARRLRVEHWDNAKRQGRLAAANMLGGSEPYRRIPYFYSDQFDFAMEYTGLAPRPDDVVIRGDPADGRFIAFWLEDDRVVAGMNVNVEDARPAIERLIDAATPVDRVALADASVPLDGLALTSDRSTAPVGTR